MLHVFSWFTRGVFLTNRKLGVLLLLVLGIMLVVGYSFTNSRESLVLATTVKFDGTATALAVSTDGEYLAATNGRHVVVYDLKSLRPIFTRRGDSESFISSDLCWALDSKFLFFGVGGEIHSLKIDNLSEKIASVANYDKLTSIRMIDNNTIITAGVMVGDFNLVGQIGTWQWNETLRKAILLEYFPHRAANAECVDVSYPRHESPQQVVATFDNGAPLLINVSDDKARRLNLNSLIATPVSQEACFSSDGKYCFFRSRGHLLCFEANSISKIRWDVELARLTLHPLSTSRDRNRSMSTSPSGILALGLDDRLLLFHHDGRLFSSVGKLSAGTTFSPNGEVLYVAHKNCIIGYRMPISR